MRQIFIDTRAWDGLWCCIMISATLWVRGPDDANWRINAVFRRWSRHDAASRVSEEMSWYHSRGYHTYVGPDAPEET